MGPSPCINVEPPPDLVVNTSRERHPSPTVQPSAVYSTRRSSLCKEKTHRNVFSCAHPQGFLPGFQWIYWNVCVCVSQEWHKRKCNSVSAKNWGANIVTQCCQQTLSHQTVCKAQMVITVEFSLLAFHSNISMGSLVLQHKVGTEVEDLRLELHFLLKLSIVIKQT